MDDKKLNLSSTIVLVSSVDFNYNCSSSIDTRQKENEDNREQISRSLFEKLQISSFIIDEDVDVYFGLKKRKREFSAFTC